MTLWGPWECNHPAILAIFFFWTSRMLTMQTCWKPSYIPHSIRGEKGGRGRGEGRGGGKWVGGEWVMIPNVECNTMQLPVSRIAKFENTPGLMETLNYLLPSLNIIPSSHEVDGSRYPLGMYWSHYRICSLFIRLCLLTGTKFCGFAFVSIYRIQF